MIQAHEPLFEITVCKTKKSDKSFNLLNQLKLSIKQNEHNCLYSISHPCHMIVMVMMVMVTISHFCRYYCFIILPNKYIQWVLLPAHCFLCKCYRNWPRYVLRWSGLCWHSRHSTSGAGRRAAACGRAGRLHECCAGSGSTNHDSGDRMSGQFLFYHENEAMHNDKSRDDHDY